jgi:hypothetical protein
MSDIDVINMSDIDVINMSDLMSLTCQTWCH